MNRRTLIGGTAAAAALLAGRSGPVSAAPVNVVVFGDSYSQVPRVKNLPNWVTQLQTAGAIGTSSNFAKSGATAAKIGFNHFARQLRLWREAGRPVGDRVMVFLGTNDILQLAAPQPQLATFDASKTGYKRGLAELKAAGANLLLIEPLDLGKVPRFADDQEDSGPVTIATRTWVRFVRNRGLPVVRLFDVFAKRLPDSTLFQDDLHLNEDGNRIVADAVRVMLAP
jgi:lysophospholipase L1-like esterase